MAVTASRSKLVHEVKHVTPVLLTYQDFCSISKLMVQITSIFSVKYFCKQNSLPKAFLTSKQLQQQPGQICFVSILGFLWKFTDSQHHNRVAMPSLKGGSIHKNSRGQKKYVHNFKKLKNHNNDY